MPSQNKQHRLKPWERLYIKLNGPGARRLLWGVAALFLLAVPLLSYLERDRWDETEVAANALPSALQELERSIGYGGFIHHFKNAILRPDDPSYYDLSVESYEIAQRAILRIQRLSRQIDQGIDINHLRSTLVDYRQQIEIARDAQIAGLSIAEVDNLVRLPDEAALLDLRQLHAQVRDAIQSWQGREARRQRIETILLGALLFAFAAIITFFQLTARSAAADRRRRAEELHSRMATLSQVTSGIAHDVNNLLATIYYALDLSMSEDLPEKTRSFLTSARKAVERGQVLTGKLLSSTRPRRGAPELLQLSDVLIDVEALARPQLADSDVTLTIAVTEPGLAALCDRGMLEDSLLNLVLNARDAMRDASQGSRIEISARPLQGSALKAEARDRMVRAEDPDAPSLNPERRYLELTISDDGPGMPPEVLERALEPFFTTKPGKSGNGLGLSMVHSFAIGAEGDLRIESAPGAGTQIHIVLPRGQIGDAERASQCAEPAPRPRPDPSPVSPRPAQSPPTEPAATRIAAELSAPKTEKATAPEGGSPRSVEGKTVLLAEDETPLRTLLSATLSGAGYTVLSAEDGQQALDLLREDVAAVDVILTDIAMPVLDGFSFAREARALRQDLPIVYLTGYTGHTAAGRKIEVQGTMLRKPCPPDLLLRSLADALARAEQERS